MCILCGSASYVIVLKIKRDDEFAQLSILHSAEQGIRQCKPLRLTIIIRIISGAAVTIPIIMAVVTSAAAAAEVAAEVDVLLLVSYHRHPHHCHCHHDHHHGHHHHHQSHCHHYIVTTVIILCLYGRCHLLL